MLVELEQMYAGIPYSPAAKLTKAITATSVEIEVDAPNKLPPAPNLANIGTDEDGETIRYNAKSGNLLKNVERGIEGTAKSWSINSEIARTFMNFDYKALVNNIKKLTDNANQSYFYVDDDGILTFAYLQQ